MAHRRGPDNSVRIAISGTYSSLPWANVFHCQLSTTSSIIQADLDAWTTAFANAYKTSFGSMESQSVAFSLAKCTLYVPGNLALSSQQTMTGTGTVVGTTVADNSACKVLSWNTNVYWRGGKPRTYVPSVGVSDVVNQSQLTSAVLTNMQTLGNNFRTAVNALVQGTITSTVFGFVSFSSGSADRNPSVFFPITGAKAHPRLGSQRRRLGRWTA